MYITVKFSSCRRSVGYQCPILGTDKRFQVQVCDRQRPIRSQIKMYLNKWIDKSVVYLNFPLSPPPPQALLFSNSRLQVRSHCLLQSQTLDPQVRAGITPLLAENFFLLKDNQVEASSRKRKIRILLSFSLRKSKLTAFTSQVPQPLGLLSHPELTCCCPSKCISGSVSGRYRDWAATFS